MYSTGEHVHTVEYPSQLFRDAVAAGVRTGLETVSDRFHDWPYHRVHHTRAVVERTQLILLTVMSAERSAVSHRALLLGQLAAAFHDTVQDFDVVTTPDGEVRMQRHTGVNEEKSAQEAERFMVTANLAAGTDVFTTEDMYTVRSAILTTIPSWSAEYHTAIQPHLTPESSVVARALALADLGVVGLDPQSAVAEGDRVFQEENLDVYAALTSGDVITEPQKERFRVRMVTWAEQQVQYFEGRYRLFEDEIADFPHAAKHALRHLFSGFTESIRRQTVVAEVRSTLSFEAIAHDMGYVVEKPTTQSGAM